MEFVPLTAETLTPFAELFRRERGVVRTHQRPEYAGWSFLDLPHAQPDAPGLELVVEDGVAIGAMGAVPQVLLGGAEELPTAFYVDWMVDSTQRRRKIGSQLIRRANSRFPVALHMGSTEVGTATVATLGTQDVGRILSARRIDHPWRWSAGSARANPATRLGWTALQLARTRRRPQLQLPPGATVRPVELRAVDGELQALSRRLAQTHVCTLRDAARWEWHLRSPLYTARAVQVQRDGATLGYALLVIGRRSRRWVGSVADLCVGRAEDVALTLTAALAQLSREAVDGLEFTVPDALGRPLLQTLGFVPFGNPMAGIWINDPVRADGLLQKPYFLTTAENLAATAGVDYPVQLYTTWQLDRRAQ